MDAMKEEHAHREELKERERMARMFESRSMMCCRMFHPTNGRNNFEDLQVSWNGALPEAPRVAQMLKREKALRLQDENQEAYACKGPSTDVTHWIQVRVCREFGLPDAAINVLRGAAKLYPDHEEMKTIPHYVHFNRSRAGTLMAGMMAPDVPLTTAGGVRTSLLSYLHDGAITVVIAGSMS
jgi:hypothetical protein